MIRTEDTKPAVRSKFASKRDDVRLNKDLTSLQMSTETPDLGRQAEPTGKVPALLIGSLEKVLRRDSIQDAAQ